METDGLQLCRRNILCTHLIKITGSGNIESLNVAQAAAVFCNALYLLR